MAGTGINREGRHFDVAIRYFEETLLDLDLEFGIVGFSPGVAKTL